MAREGETRRARRASREDLLADIVEYGEKVLAKAKGLSEEELVADEDRYDAILYRLQCVSEAVTQLLASDPTIRDRYPELPWAQIKGVSNVLRHAYAFVSADVVRAAIAEGDLDRLIAFAQVEARRTPR